MTGPEQDHWLSRPETVRRIWLTFGVLLALTVLAEVVIDIEGYFGIDGWFGFGAAFGFGTCVIMVFGAKLLGLVLKRPDDYYHD